MAPLPGPWPRGGTLLSILLLCVLIVLVRRAPLASDRVWSDEGYILSGAHGLSHEALPRWFRSADLAHASYGDVLRDLAGSDAYPPVVYTVAFFSAKVADPIFAPRVLFVLVTAACAVGIFLAARRRRLRGALLVTVLAFCASGVARTGADVKWSAVAPALMAVCTLTLLAALERRTRPVWVLYGALLLLCLGTHYFTLSVVPAHALYVAWFRRESLRAWTVTALVVLVACLPWYLWALPQQIAYVNGFFAGLDPAVAVPSWRTPLTVRSWLVWLGYNVLTVFGFEPSSVRAAFVLPLAVTVLTTILLSLRRAPAIVRHLAVLGALQMAVAFLAQSVYSLQFGHTAMLTWAYFATWSPALLLSWGFAGMAGGWPSRLAVAVLSAWTLAHAAFLPPDEDRYRDSLDHRRQVAALVGRKETGTTALVHRSDSEAKLLGLYYRGPLAQTVCADACGHDFPESVDTLLVVSPGTWPDLAVGDAWSLGERERLGRSVIVTYRRKAGLCSAALYGSLVPHGG